MHISAIKIRNFRKLENVEIDFSPDTTVFIGANNSGKTSAITAINLFLTNQNLSHYDFSLHNHIKINELFEAEKVPTAKQLESIFPTMDLWFHVENDDIHLVSSLLPTLDWQGGDLGVRLRYEIKDVSKLQSEYRKARDKVKNNPDLFPKSMTDFLSRYIGQHFEMRRYILDPAQKKTIQSQESLGEALGENPLKNLIQVNIINAQRGINDEIGEANQAEKRKLTTLMTNYYSAHLDPNKGEISDEDINALLELQRATEAFTLNMKSNFKPVLDELSKIGYPPFGAPSVTINPQIRATDGISHSNALQYQTENGLALPETYNGLGYQNLIFITFKMIGFRDGWIKYGKMKSSETGIAPVHLVLIEEPEAHLHPQAQQVFINRAYKILTDRSCIKDGNLTTQLLVSTHSSHITHECEFKQLRYFKRIIRSRGENPITEVINLTNIFEKETETERFVARYIKLACCDLFFADSAILIEGDAERILMPHFIAKHQNLAQSHVCVLPIGGSHAYKLKPLMEKLCIPTLIVTDLDSTEKVVGEKNKTIWKAKPSKRNTGQKTCNTTLKNWLPGKESIDDLLDVHLEDKMNTKVFPVCVAYQTKEGERTFEDALKNDNDEWIKTLHGDKVEYILNILESEQFDDLRTPNYIEDGLTWLDDIMNTKLNQSIVVQSVGDADGK